jgi:hypothetical protein
MLNLALLLIIAASVGAVELSQMQCGQPGVRCSPDGKKVLGVRLLTDGVGCPSGRVPSEISRLTDLEELQISGNNASFPGWWRSMGWCPLVGTLPSEVGLLTKLRVLNLMAQSIVSGISGTVPTELGKLSLLERLDLDGHESGTLPTEIGTLGRLQSINLEGGGGARSRNYRRISGTLPSEWAGLTSLDRVYLGSNSISGTLPPSYGLGWGEVSWIEFFVNRISGTIPSTIGRMHSLGALHLFENPISGTLPPQMGELTHLLVSEMDKMRLSGSLPESILELPALRDLGHRGTNLKANHPFSNLDDAFASYNKNKSVCDVCAASQWRSMFMLNSHRPLCMEVEAEGTCGQRASASTANMVTMADAMPSTHPQSVIVLAIVAAVSPAGVLFLLGLALGMPVAAAHTGGCRGHVLM